MLLLAWCCCLPGVAAVVIAAACLCCSLPVLLLASVTLTGVAKSSRENCYYDGDYETMFTMVYRSKLSERQLRVATKQKFVIAL